MFLQVVCVICEWGIWYVKCSQLRGSGGMSPQKNVEHQTFWDCFWCKFGVMIWVKLRVTKHLVWLLNVVNNFWKGVVIHSTCTSRSVLRVVIIYVIWTCNKYNQNRKVANVLLLVSFFVMCSGQAHHISLGKIVRWCSLAWVIILLKYDGGHWMITLNLHSLLAGSSVTQTTYSSIGWLVDRASNAALMLSTHLQLLNDRTYGGLVTLPLTLMSPWKKFRTSSSSSLKQCPLHALKRTRRYWNQICCWCSSQQCPEPQSAPGDIVLLHLLQTLLKHCLAQITLVPFTFWLAFYLLASCGSSTCSWSLGFSNLLPEQVKVVLCPQPFKSLHCEHHYFITFNTRELGLLQYLTKLMCVAQNHFREDKTKQKPEDCIWLPTPWILAFISVSDVAHKAVSQSSLMLL